MSNLSSTALVTVASSGIGLSAANHLACNNFDVWGVSRRKIEDASFNTLVADVCSTSSITKAVEVLQQGANSIDVFLHCAGNGLATIGHLLKTFIAAKVV